MAVTQEVFNEVRFIVNDKAEKLTTENWNAVQQLSDEELLAKIGNARTVGGAVFKLWKTMVRPGVVAKAALVAEIVEATPAEVTKPKKAAKKSAAPKKPTTAKKSAKARKAEATKED